MLGLHKVHLVLGRLDYEQDPLNSSQHPLNFVLWGSSEGERKREGGRQNLEVDVLIDANIVGIGRAEDEVAESFRLDASLTGGLLVL